jgi:hypothetical protein
VLSQVGRGVIGLSSVGASLPGVDGAAGLCIQLGNGGSVVRAPIAPGVIAAVPVAHWHTLQLGEAVTVAHAPTVIALDGEREVSVRPGEHVAIRLTQRGPHLVDVGAALAQAAREGIFVG